ncbi:MAG: magnesium transporter [Bacteroidetes bacterium]|nr:MAG: magnesium transporter [Bacteroidota bacterium]RLD70763.1 MAG: magnesium transporter [Bacteroidota bacterium]RLD94105.1 MAG: magnesium transporter [Bacteroidota bacterium]
MSTELTREYINDLKSVIEKKDNSAALDKLNQLHPADIAEIYENLSLEEATYLYLLLDPEKASDVLVELEEDERESFLKALPSDVIASQFIDHMESDDAADVIGDLAEDKKQEVLLHIDDVEQAGDIVDLLSYDEDSAGGLMAKELIRVNENWGVATCIREMRKQAEDLDEIYYIYVVSDENVLLGILSLKALLLASASTRIKDIYDAEVRSVQTDADSEEVAQIMEKYDLIVLPVTDSIGRLMGRITIDDVVDVIRDEAERDYQLASGITADVETTDSPARLSRARLPWLIIGLLGGIVVAAVIGRFEEDIKINPEMAFFIPLIAAMAGNVGIQSSAIIVQGIASNSLGLESTYRKLGKETIVALMNGLILSGLLFLYNYFFTHNLALTFTVSTSLFVVIVFAALFGTLIPLLLNRMKIDPALATGPFITTMNDIMGLFIYFLMGRILYAIFI